MNKILEICPSIAVFTAGRNTFGSWLANRSSVETEHLLAPKALRHYVSIVLP